MMHGDSPKGLKPKRGQGRARRSMQAMPCRQCHAGDATPRGCGRCKCQAGDSAGAASRKQIRYVKIAFQMRALLGRRLASQAGVWGFLIPPPSMDAARSSTTWGRWPGAQSCPPAVPLPSQKLPRIPAHCLLPVPWLLQLLHVQALRFLIALYFTILLIALNISHAFASLMSGCEFVANNTTYYTARINMYIKPVL